MVVLVFFVIRDLKDLGSRNDNVGLGEIPQQLLVGLA